MFGFFCSFGGSDPRSWNYSKFTKNVITKYFYDNSFYCLQKTLPKFENDKVFVDTHRYFYAIEGFLFNKQIMEEIATSYFRSGQFDPSKLRGSFAGIFYDKIKQVCFVFNDQIGSKILFYTRIGDATLVSSDLKILSEQIPNKKYDLQYMYSLLQYGYSPTHHSILSEVQRIPAGKYLRIERGACELLQYHVFDNCPQKLSEEKAIDKLDILFNNAVRRVLDKNSEYAYDNISTLSAGLDSRVVCCVAKKMCQADVQFLTYSQPNFFDEIVPKQIAEYLQCPIAFISLNDGEYLKNVNNSICSTEALINYSGPAQVNMVLETTSTLNMGIILTGCNGDKIVASDIRHNDEPYNFEDWPLASVKYMELKKMMQLDAIQYPNREMHYIYTRAFDCTNLGLPLAAQYYSESYSPFTDVDFLEFVLSIPTKNRWWYGLYDKWILKKYPDMAQWKHNGEDTIGKRPCMVYVAGRTMPLKDVPKRIIWRMCKKMHIYDFYALKENQSMNPIDSWMKEGTELRQYLDCYFNSHIQSLEYEPNLLQYAKNQYVNGSAYEKLQVITLLGSIDYIN